MKEKLLLIICLLMICAHAFSQFSAKGEENNISNKSRYLLADEIANFGLNSEQFDVLKIDALDKKSLSVIDSLSRYRILVKKNNGIKDMIRISQDQISSDIAPAKISLYLSSLEGGYGIDLQIECDSIIIVDSQLDYLQIKGSMADVVEIARTSVKSRFSFSGNEISSSLYIHDSNFSKGVLLEVNHIVGQTRISGNTIGGDLSTIQIPEEQVEGYLIYDNRFLSEKTHFIGNEKLLYPFDGLEGCTFTGRAFFITSDSYRKTVGFPATIQIQNTEFEIATFDGAMPNYLAFKNISIEEKADFRYVNPETQCFVDFDGSDIDKILINPVNFTFVSSQLMYYDYQKKSHQDGAYERAYKEIDAMYKKFLNAYRSKGADEDFKVIDLNYKKFKYFSRGYSSFLDGVYYIVSKVWWNFGYSKHRVLLWPIVLVIVFTVSSLRKISYFLNEVYCIDSIKMRMDEINARDNMNRFAYYGNRFGLTLFYVSILFFGFKFDVEKIKFSTMRWPVYLALIYTIGLICSGYLLNYFVTT